MARSLLEITDLAGDELQQLLTLAQNIAEKNTPKLAKDIAVATVFFENSTRTRVSFELAAKRLGLTFCNVDINVSSQAKGETVLDTCLTLKAMGFAAVIMRHKQERLINQIAQQVPDLTFINAGDGMHAHPSQALLDALTINQQKKVDWPALKITIVGDIKHSRVTPSLTAALTKLGVQQIIYCAPNYFLPEQLPPNVAAIEDLAAALADSDVIYTLRVQQERFDALSEINLQDYIDNYQITKQRLLIAKPTCRLMHPGPINRNVELADAVADSSQSDILKQVENGLYMRMAMLTFLLNGDVG